MSSDDIAIRVSNLSKCYQIYDAPRDRLKQFVVPRLQRFSRQIPRQYFRQFWALKDVTFEIRKGETVGIIGRNGSGKSTLLQVICGTLSPNSGSVETNGRIAALLELGSGFNPEFTGRENVYMSAALLGMSREEIDKRFYDIASFADIGEFIEQPIKTYSSGMFVRLAFAVNIVSDPEIMIIDEALAVGDMNFQAKCMTALSRIQKRGATVLFVSHDVGAVKSLCSRGVYLEHGTIKAIGKAPDVAELYIRNMREEMNKEQQEFACASTNFESCEPSLKIDQTLKIGAAAFRRSEEFDKRVAAFRYGSGGARITYAELLDDHDQPIINVEFNQLVSVVICFETEIEKEISCNYYVADEKRNLVIGSGMRLSGKRFLKSRSSGRYTVIYKTRMPLHEGSYSIQLQVTQPLIIDETAEFLDVIDDAIVFKVSRNPQGRIWTQVHVPNSVQVFEA
jgi:lipopolysaccharide transport system ATP-binding protein